MAKALRLTAEQRDDLVAYLDGELEEAQTQYIDQVLARSEVARHEVEALARTWELLDLLPKPNATEGFTDRTITTLKVSEMATPLTEQPWFDYVRKGTIAAVWVLVLSVCAAVGFVITTQAVPNEQAELLAEMPMIRNLDVYLEIEDLEFVRELQRSNQFTHSAAAEPDASPTETATTRTLAKAPIPTDRAGLTDQYQKVAAMSQADRDRIQRNWDLFRQMTPARQAYFRDLHQQLTEQPEALRTLLETYAAWLPTLSPGNRDDLRQAGGTAQRLDLVRKFKDEQDASRETRVFDLDLDLKRMRQMVPPPPYLSADELTAMMIVVEKKLPFSERQNLDQQGKLLPIERFVRILGLTFGTSSRLIDAETGAELIALISDETLRQRMESTPPEHLRGALSGLIVRSLFKQIADKQEEFFPSVSQLEQVFVAQKGDDRHKLMQLPSHELRRELLTKYWEQQSSEEARRLAKAREELSKFFWASMGPGGPRPGFGGYRGDRGKDGDRRPPRGGPEGGRPPEPPPKTDPR